MLGKLRIRDYRETDFDRLYQIDQLCFDPRIAYSRSEIAFYLRHPGSTTKVAEISDEIVGFALGKIEGDSFAHVITLDVAPHARHRGVGTQLMEALHKDFVRQHAAVSILEVSAEDEGARKFYERLQYKYADNLPGYYDGRTDACRMFCLLRGHDRPWKTAGQDRS